MDFEIHTILLNLLKFIVFFRKSKILGTGENRTDCGRKREKSEGEGKEDCRTKSEEEGEEKEQFQIMVLHQNSFQNSINLEMMEL